MLWRAVIRRNSQNSWEVHDYSQITVNYCFVITKYHSREETTNYNNKKPTLFSDQNIILLQAEVDKDI